VKNILLDLSENDRVLVLGASGWFGKTAVELSTARGASVMSRTSNGNELLGKVPHFELSNSFQKCLDFQPSVVIDCAFVTRQLISSYGMAKYLSTNKNLMGQALQLQAQPFVRRFIGISSGAAVPYLLEENRDQKLDPYGFLKASYERMLTNREGLSKQNVVLIRPYSVSGKNCRARGIYALYDLIEQSKSRSIQIKSRELVYRRYTDVEDLLRVALLVPTGGGIIESGGELIEIGDLANLIIEELDSGAEIERTIQLNGKDSYHSDNESWKLATATVGIQPKSLREQIRVSANR